MKRGFTLVEMLIVVVVLVTLMSMVFRIGNIGEDTKARNETLNRMQRLEFALSGYYAAFGTYPPVKLHGSRNIYLEVDSHGIQNLDGEENTSIWGWYKESGDHGYNSEEEKKAWRQVEAACLAQPVACEFPFPDNYAEMVEAVSESMKTAVEQDPDKYSQEQISSYAAGFDDGVTANIGRFNAYRDKSEWRDLQLFRFGVLSYLLPRYLFMMNGDQQFFENFVQWTGNNSLPCDPLTGQQYGSWTKLQDQALKDSSAELARVANIPSQAACARWMPTFEKSLCCNHKFSFFGIEVRDTDHESQTSPMQGQTPQIYSPGGFDDASTSGQYMLDCITMRDGWGKPLYYYSPAPHQSYVVWSGGKNQRTFPPWISRKGLDGAANRCVAFWVEDDVVNLSH